MIISTINKSKGLYETWYEREDKTRVLVGMYDIAFAEYNPYLYQHHKIHLEHIYTCPHPHIALDEGWCI